ncbi:MAG: TlpA family protein disulfide reductase [Rhodobacteraceae bacterium]|nr:TlpA family protein disulfide reductase [Paracoccaceae bacterium]
MTKPTETETRSGKRPIVIGLASVLVILGAVYVIWGANGNSVNAQTCDQSMKIAETIKPLAKGDVAAFLPAQSPLPLNTLEFKDPEGQPVKMSQFEDKTILLNLWATWCAPCRHEMPALNELHTIMSSDTFEVVTVNLDRGGIEKPKAFFEEVGADALTLYNDPSNTMLGELRKKGRGTGLPTTILIGPDGCEVGTMYGPAEWASSEAMALIKAALSKLTG